MAKRQTLIFSLLLLAGLWLLLAMPVLGQSEAQERSRFLSFVEDQLSAPGRKIRITGIEGALSSSASIAAITISDDDGVWLAIEQAAIEWNRGALFRGRLEIETLQAARINWPRMGVAPESLPSPEAGRFEVPELPLAISIGTLEVEQVNLGEPLFGLAAQLTGRGALELEDGSLDARFDVERLDGPGGTLSLEASYANASTQLGLNVSIDEPADGVLANVLNLDGRPPVSLMVQGGGPLDNLDVNLALNTDAGRVLSGGLQMRQQGDGRAFSTTLEGPVSALVAPAYRVFFGSQSTIVAQGFLPTDGGLRLDDLAIESGTLSLNGSATTAPDGFPTQLQLNARFGDGTNAMLLPLPGQNTRAVGGSLEVSYGRNDQWLAQLRFDNLQSGALTVGRTAFDVGGTANNLADPLARAITFAGQGQISGFENNDAAIAQALGQAITTDLVGRWQAGDPVQLDQLQITGDALTATARGVIQALVFDGTLDVDVRTLTPLAALAERPLAGAMRVQALGTLDMVSSGFDLDLNGLTRSVSLGVAAADAILQGDVTLRGGLARDENGLAARNLRLDGQQVTAVLDGILASGASDIALEARLADVSRLTEQASGAAQLSARALSDEGPLALTATLQVPNGRLVDQALRSGQLIFDGTLEDNMLAGALTLAGELGGAALQGQANLRATREDRSLSGLAFQTRGASLSGDLVQDVASGLLRGNLDLRAQDIRTLASLALLEASGTFNAELALAPSGLEQTLTTQGSANALTVNTFSIGEARFDVGIADLFGVPRATGTVVGERLRAGEVTITTLNASSQRTGSFAVMADGISAPQLVSAGLGPARLRADGRYSADAIELSSANLSVGGVEATANGRIPFSGNGLNVSAGGTVPIALAQPFLRDRGTQLSGVAAINARVTGAVDAPTIAGAITLNDGQIVDPDSNIRLTGVNLAARLTGQGAVIEQAAAQIAGGGTVSLAGRVGFGAGLPADLAIALRQVRYADGELVTTTADGNLTVTGPLASGPLLSGNLRLLETNIQIPDSFGDAGGLIDLEHIAPSDRVRATFERARRPQSSNGGGGAALRLDVQVDAPNQIYVRGRGVNAELGGSVRLTGTTDSVVPVGAFNLIRGRIDILGQRIALSTGSITLVGDSDPFLNIEAETEGDSIVVVIAVRGRVSEPTVTLSSSPELPQDEVLARLIFNRSLNELSPLQIAQLALAAAELAGQSNGSALGSLRDGLGLSDLDVVSDEEGNIGVRAGQYVQENVYVGVEASADGSARTTINLDITEDITARGAVGTDGNSSLGIFFERDY
jgi:translocation and assembly module TamB